MIYKDIPGYEKRYGISKSGEVIRREEVRPYKINGYTSLHKEIVLKHSISKKGYHRVQLRKKMYEHALIAVHRLVYMAYKGEIGRGLQINHIDGNKSNNHISNLELCTGKENVAHAWKTGLAKVLPSEKNPGVKLNWDKVRKIRSLYNGKEFSQRKLATQFNVSRSTIKDIVRNLAWDEIKNNQ